QRGACGFGVVVGAFLRLLALSGGARALHEMVGEPRPDRSPSLVVLVPAEPAIPRPRESLQRHADSSGRSAYGGLGHGEPGHGRAREPDAPARRTAAV